MKNIININQIDEKIKPFIEEYLDGKYPDDALTKMPSVDKLDMLSADVHKQLLTKYPEFEQILGSSNDGQVQVAFWGCGGYLLWGLLAGSLYSRCNRSRCRCGRNCRCGCGCRR